MSVPPVPPFTPGSYLRLRREAAGLSIADVAGRLATEPRIAEHARAEWLAQIEADEMPATFNTLVALYRVVSFDFHALGYLSDRAMGGGFVVAVQLCRSCACSQQDGCEEGCFWAEPNLCSACVETKAVGSAAA